MEVAVRAQSSAAAHRGLSWLLCYVRHSPPQCRKQNVLIP